VRRRFSSPHLVGRASQLAGLVDALAEVAVAGSGVALVGGEPGVGKTRLVAEFTQRARAEGATVLVGGCVRLDGAAPPYAPVAQALGRLPVELVGSGGGAVRRARLFDGVVAAVTGLAGTAPVILVLEDVHWADRSTLDLAGYLVHALGPARVLVVVTYRIEELDQDPRLRAWLVGLRRAGRATAIELPPLSDDEVAAQIEAILGEPPPRELVAAVTARADGNPFYVEELVAARDGLPPSLRDVLVSRLEALPARTRRVLRMCAVVGRQIEEPLLRAVTRMGADGLAAAIRPAVASHVLRPLPDRNGYEFRHELVREAADAELMPGERMAVHAAVAEWLAEQRPALDAEELSRIAYHWCGAEDDHHAIPALVAAGSAALRAGGFVEAYAQLAKAARRWLALGWKPEDEVGPGVDLAEVARMALHAASLGNDIPDARRLGDAVLAVLDPEAATQDYATLVGWLGLHRMLEGDVAGAHEAYVRALALLPATPSRLRAWVLARYAKVCMLLDDDEPAIRYGREALTMARQLGEREVEGVVLTVLGPLADDPIEGISLVRDGLAIAREYGDLDGVVRGYTNLTHLLGCAWRVEECRAVSMDGLAVTAQLGVAPARSAILRLNGVSALYAIGDWTEALRLLDEVLDRPLPVAIAPAFPLLAARIHVARGDFARAAALLDAPVDGAEFEAERDAVAAELAIWQDRPADALAAAERAVTASAAVGWPVAIGIRAAMDLAQVAAAQRHPDTATDLTRRAQALAAILERRRGDPAEAPWHPLVAAELARSDPDAWRAAGDTWHAIGQRWWTAYCRYRLAEALVNGGRARAGEALGEAYRHAEQAAPLRAMAERLARRARLALEPQTAREPAETPPDPALGTGLTRRELDVLRLLADGCTNAAIASTLFISAKTVDTHVSNVLRKLGVARRTEAAAVAHRLGL
jgi:DNA-binding CsgD family transcriptional regulator/tetratricopeptide (TPR) repeat protein